MSDQDLQVSVIAELKTVMDPDLHKDIVTLGFVKNMNVEGGKVKFQVELTTPACPVKEQLKTECETKVSAIKGVKSVEVEMTAVVRAAEHTQPILTDVKNVIAVASGKGGLPNCLRGHFQLELGLGHREIMDPPQNTFE